MSFVWLCWSTWWHINMFTREKWETKLKKNKNNFLKTLATPNYMRWGLELKLQYFGHLTWRADLLEKTLILGKTEGKRGQQRMRYLDSITDSMDINWRKLRRMVVDRGAVVHEDEKSWTWLSDWTTTIKDLRGEDLREKGGSRGDAHIFCHSSCPTFHLEMSVYSSAALSKRQETKPREADIYSGTFVISECWENH